MDGKLTTREYADEDDDSILREARERYQECETAESENRENGLESIRFSVGEQWPEKIKQERDQEARPCLTINKMPTHIRQVVNDARQNRPQMKVSPMDSAADPETAEILDGVLRHIQAHSNAENAYDTAVEYAVRAGFGYFRLVTDYSHSDTFDLDIFIRRVPNPFTVYLDPSHKESDGSDAMFAFVHETMRKKEFEAKYPDAKISEWNSSTGEGYEGWFSEDSVRVAEYWRRVPYTKQLALLADGSTVEMTEGIDPAQVIRTREVSCYRVVQHVLTGAEVLSTKEFPGQWIPIFPVYGEEVNIEGKRYLFSLIHHSMDAQRMFNYWRTAATERVALEPKAPWVGPVGSFETARSKWNTANAKNYPVLEYDLVPGGPPPQRQGPPQGAAAYINEALAAADDIKATMGQFDASLGARSNETSGKAIMARQREGDVSTFHFIDNLGKSIRHAGRVLMEWLPEIYTGERVLRVLGQDGESKMITINRMFVDKSGKPKVYDLAAGKYDVEVTIGPSYTTQRQEASTQMIELARAQPQIAQIAGDLIVGNMDWPGARELAKRIKKVIPPHITQDEDEQQQIPPQVQQMIEQGKQQMAQMGQQIQQMQAELQKRDAVIAQKDAAIASAQKDAQMSGADLQLKGMDIEQSRIDAEKQRIDLQKQMIDLEKRKAELQSTLAQLQIARVQNPQPGVNEHGEPVEEPREIGKKKSFRIVPLDDGSYAVEGIEQPIMADPPPKVEEDQSEVVNG